MSNKEVSGINKRLSASERRRQIIAAAVRTISTSGYAQATFHRIAKTAGLSSTGLISYHFTEKGELMQAVVDDVWAKAFSFIRPRMDRQPTPGAILREFIVASVEFYAAYPAEVAALQEVRTHLRDADGRLRYDERQFDAEIAELEGFLTQAQAGGEMGDFDTHVAALSLRGALNSARAEFLRNPDFDHVAYAAELVRLFDRATEVEK